MPTKFPPQVSLTEAIRIIKDIYRIHKTNEISEDLLPDIFKVKQRSSYFPATIAALNKFGLVEKRPNGILKLTSLAMQIVKPFNNEDVEAKLVAAKNDELLLALIEKYPNYVLPSPEQTQHTLVKQFGIDRDTVGKWFLFVSESFRELKANKNVVESSQNNIEEKPKEQNVTPQNLITNVTNSNAYSFTIPLSDGSFISVSIPQSAKQKDLKKMKSIIDALVEDESNE